MLFILNNLKINILTKKQHVLLLKKTNTDLIS
jgi:hypothetical protein